MIYKPLVTISAYEWLKTVLPRCSDGGLMESDVPPFPLLAIIRRYRCQQGFGSWPSDVNHMGDISFAIEKF